MAATQPVHSEVDKPEEDPVKDVILLWREEQTMVSEMIKYHNNLSRHLLIRL